DIQLATFQKIRMPNDEQLATYSKQAIDNTMQTIAVTVDAKNPLPPLPALRESPIKYIVYITKENRSYDEVFG
ncbi:hypothetical protein, partial [Klebsiella pneumoniae]